MILNMDNECARFIIKHPEEFENYGCGPGGWGDIVVPDTIYGVSVRDACRIHDWCYRHAKGADEGFRLRHDQQLYRNCLLIVNAKSNWIMRPFRRARCWTYYKMVRQFGSFAYWEERK